MAAIDVVVVLTVVSATCAASNLLWRRGLRRRRLLSGAWLAFYGVMLVTMMVAHSAEIVYRTFSGSATASPWAYDFRMYSLHLLSAVLIWQGVTVLRSVLTIVRVGRIPRPGVQRAAWVTLALGLPLIPIQTFFGLLLAATSVVTLVVLAVAQREQMAMVG